MGKVAVGVLGATGTVGQRYLCLLKDHKVFTVKGLGASPLSVGKRYAEAVKWKLPQNLYPDDSVANLVIVDCCVDAFKEMGCRVIFSGLDASIARTLEAEFVQAGFCVFSNASTHRMDPSIPLVVPTVNPHHLQILRPSLESGFIVTNANCSSTGLVVPLAALIRKFGPLSHGKVYRWCAAVSIAHAIENLFASNVTSGFVF